MSHAPATEDLVSPVVLADPYPVYERLRSISPVRYLYIPEGSLPDPPRRMEAWAALRYGDVRTVLKDHKTFSSQRPLAGRMMPKLVLLQDDPPRHTEFRKLVQRAFTPRQLSRLEPEIERIAETLFDGFPSGSHEFISGFAGPLPVRVIARMMGIPEDQHETYRRWSDTALSLLSISREKKSREREELEEFFADQIARSKKRGGGTTLIDVLVNPRDGSKSLEHWEIVGFCILLLVAGNETTANLLGSMFALLARRPDLWLLLKADRSLVPAFIEEALRYESPLQRMTRIATRDVQMGSALIRKGDPVVAFIGAANRDPDVFDEPNDFRLDRPRSDILAFGVGIHYCLGAALAQMEARVALNCALDRFSGLEFIAEERQTSKLIVLGHRSLDLSFNS